MHSHDHSPSRTGSVVLDIGDDRGALVIFTSPEHLGREIEISRVAGPDAPPPARVHAAVRERHLDGHTLYGAVYPGLPEGSYTVWADEVMPVASVRIYGGEITEFNWPASGG